MMPRWLAPILLVATALAVGFAVQEEDAVKVGSKKFTESVILGELLKHVIESTGRTAVHRAELGGTRILFNALRSGDLDAYPEYTGTISQEILAGRNLSGEAEIRAALREMGIVMTAPLGFNNTYALGMKKDRAAAVGVGSISDLRDHPELRFGFTNEFMDRSDGWPNLRDAYALPQKNVRGLDHDIAYRALASGDIDVMDLYSTDAEIKYYDLQVLSDDAKHFPLYDAVVLYRADLEERAPRVVAAFRALEGRIPEADMIAMNALAKIDKQPEGRVAADFANSRLGLAARFEAETAVQRIMRYTKGHLFLVSVSMLAAVVVAIPLGIVAVQRPAAGQVILAVAGIIQTIPALALLVVMMAPLRALGLPGIGNFPAIVALFLYSLLPIIRNTFTGLRGLSPEIRESAAALGLSAGARLRLIELPLASSMILAGIKTATVINVGFATLGALVGSDGFGQPILTGIRRDDYGTILEGALPAAVLALLVQGLFELAERFLVPRGLRLKPTE